MKETITTALFTERMKEEYREEMLSMMERSDDEFVPPLSSRASTTDRSFSDKEESSVLPYFESMMKQEIIGAFRKDTLLAYLSYKKDYEIESLTEKGKPNLYLSTLISKPEERGQRLGERLFTALFTEFYPDRDAYSRTWSTNDAEIHIFAKVGFKEVKRLKGDRGRSVDTIYYKRSAAR